MATTSIRGSLDTSLHPSTACVSSFCAVPGWLIWSIKSGGWYAEPSHPNCGPCGTRTPMVRPPSVYAPEVLAPHTPPPEFSHLLLRTLSRPVSNGHVAPRCAPWARRDSTTEWGAGSRRGVLHDRYRASLAEAGNASVALKGHDLGQAVASAWQPT